MRKLINILTESAGDSKLPLDDLAKKYIGPNYRWQDTHYKNILDKVEPPSEQFKLALRLDNGSPGDIMAELLTDNVEQFWPAFTDETYAILGYQGGSEEPIPPESEQSIQNICAALLKTAQFESDDPSDLLSVTGYFYVVDCGPKCGMLLTMSSDVIYGWYLGSPANPGQVNAWLKKFRAQYDKSHPRQ